MTFGKKGMIRTDGLSEISEKSTDISRAYLNIKPSEQISDQDVLAFLRKEFENAHDVTRFDTYDKLLSDVFNCTEEEINIDFTFSDKILNLLDNFRQEKWDSLDDHELVSFINEPAKAIGEELGLDRIPIINISECDDAYGYYDPKNNSITLNNMLLSDPIELVDTIAHELRHAYQYMRADILDTREDALYKVNFENYITPIPLPEGGWLNFLDYYNQYVEVDARAFADKFTEAM